MQVVEENGRSRKPLVIGLAAALVIAGAVAVAYQARDLTPHRAATGPQAYFTTDEGKTLVTDDPKRLPPFDLGGKEAVLAHVYRCDGQQFVGYLERCTPAGLKAAEALKAASGVPAGPNGPRIDGTQIQLATGGAGREVKRPGDAGWVPMLSAAGAKVVGVKCPHGKGSAPEVVEP